MDKDSCRLDTEMDKIPTTWLQKDGRRLTQLGQRDG
jgi:hypothetical protein